MVKVMKATLVIAMVFFVTMTIQSSNALAESPHSQIMQRLDAIQDTLDYDVVPYMTGMGVPKTGKTLSYLPGDDGDLRQGVPWPDPRFTDNEDDTVTDNLTGLIWTQSANLYGTTTLSVALTSCSSCAEGGYTDWRLPNVRELQTLIDYGQPPKPMLPAGHPFTGPFGPGDYWYYWSSTTNGITEAFCISFENGFMWSLSAGNVWCVRGGN
jgi:hypothetical protein